MPSSWLFHYRYFQNDRDYASFILQKDEGSGKGHPNFIANLFKSFNVTTCIFIMENKHLYMNR
jgi:hypothetical protein